MLKTLNFLVGYETADMELTVQNTVPGYRKPRDLGENCTKNTRKILARKIIKHCFNFCKILIR